MSKIPTIPYLTGFDVKPSITSPTGVVTFTDGTNEIIPNQLQCEAYGYTYNKADGTCSIFRFNSNLDRSFSNVTNKLQGAGNTTETGTNNTYIIGENNTVKGLSRNNIVVGNNNEIANGVNNANVYGTNGEATADNSIVLGGNLATDLLGERQSIQVIYGIQTTNGTNTISYLNNTTDKLLAVPENAIMYFHADVIAVRVGGTGTGNLGDYASWVERGVIINESGTLSVSRERDAIKSNGTVSNWQPTGIASGTNFAMRVRGATNVTIEWCSNITFTQIKTGVAL
tara:strand:- start:1777 stop:2631 length:855 start_codon:yes stop_codon:yes gene_type:complete